MVQAQSQKSWLSSLHGHQWADRRIESTLEAVLLPTLFSSHIQAFNTKLMLMQLDPDRIVEVADARASVPMAPYSLPALVSWTWRWHRCTTYCLFNCLTYSLSHLKCHPLIPIVFICLLLQKKKAVLFQTFFRCSKEEPVTQIGVVCLEIGPLALIQSRPRLISYLSLLSTPSPSSALTPAETCATSFIFLILFRFYMTHPS